MAYVCNLDKNCKKRKPLCMHEQIALAIVGVLAATAAISGYVVLYVL